MSTNYFDVQVQLDVAVADEVASQLETAARTTLHCEGVEPPAALTLLLTDNEQIQQLNRDFLEIDRPTDVLSFPNGERRRDGVLYLGDIAVSVPYAARQAAAGGHSLEAELQLLVVHGVLHLLGHDHAEPAEKMVMWAAQTAVLAQLGLSDVAPTER